MEADYLYMLTAYFGMNGLEIHVNEYEITHETSKSYMSKSISPWKMNEKISFPKEDEGKVKIDAWNGNFHRAELFLTELSLEDAETHGVEQLKAEMRKWVEKRVNYGIEKMKAIDDYKLPKSTN